MKSSKVCTGCGKEYPLSHLYWETTVAGKYTAQCRYCIRKRRSDTKELRRNGYRVCPTCKETKPLTDFENTIGRTSCKVCKSKMAVVEKQEKLKAVETEEQIEQAYRRVLAVKDYGLNNKPLGIKLNTKNKYRLSYPDGYTDGKVMEGHIIQMTDRFFVLQSDTGIREAFTYDDYKLGEYTLEVKQ